MKTISFILLFFLASISQCFATTVIYNGDGDIDRIINLNINGDFYNVDFIEGSFTTVYSNQIPTYENYSSQDALMAIRDSLNNESPIPFTFADSSIFGIETPRELLQDDWFGLDFITPFIDSWAEPIGLVTQRDHIGNWAIITAVPIPSALLLLGTGLLIMLKIREGNL
ncbi:MAG: hypothetical protein KKE62_19570 [Proteobacteria bacterium]|nr:hypothetical protein [Pseudomonadota bacterium]MBU1390009.1 hypothetical protein [Pseudomonadota bacterium]MBU1545040.1 hypothetical protein [Pseudomonadota bacterium]MBU2480356.1 hypothetical protein [Pseudomonadota bacterium]